MIKIEELKVCATINRAASVKKDNALAKPY